MGDKQTAFTMKVGIDVGATVTQFESDISKVIATFNAKQHNVKIGFDLKSVKDYGKAVGEVVEQTKKIKLPKQDDFLRNSTALVKERFKLMGILDKNRDKFILSEKKGSKNFGGIWTGVDKEAQVIANRINSVETAYGSLMNTIKKGGLGKGEAFLIDGIDEKTAIENHIQEINRLIEARDAIGKNPTRGNNEEYNEANKLIEAEEKRHEKLLKQYEIRRREVAALYSYINAEQEKYELSSGIRGSNTKSKLDKSVVTEAISTLKQLNALKREGEKGIADKGLSVKDGVWKNETAEYAQLATSLNDLTSKYKDMKAAVKNVSSEEQERFRKAEKSIQKENALRAESEKRQAKELFYKKTLNDAYTQYNKMSSNLKRWSAAGGIFAGKDAQSHYTAYTKATADLGALLDKVKSGNVNPEELAKGFDDIARSANLAAKGIKDAGKDTQSFGVSLSSALRRVIDWVGATQLVMTGVRYIKEMAKTAVEIEASMAQLQIVTRATDMQMEAFLSKSIGLAKELGKSVTEVLGSVETFSRLGYGLEDASDLAKYANILANVADVDVKTATTGLTSIIKGYGMDVSNSEHVADVLVEVGQKYAISAEELMAAFQRGGAALAASGTDFEKSAALFAATNASLQNAETVGKHICPAA